MKSTAEAVNRPDVIYYVATSLDGQIATADGGVDWLAPFEATGTDYGYAEFFRSVDALVMGRKTFEKSLSFATWPYEERTCRVFSSHRSRGALPPAVALTREDPTAVVEALGAGGARRIWLVGGGRLAGEFLSRGLISETILSLVPVVLGAGIPLFGGHGAPPGLELREVHSFPNGLVQLRYRHNTGPGRLPERP